MSEAEARAEVEKEMSRRYKPNPWDAPGGRRARPARKTKAVERVCVEEGKQEMAVRKDEKHSEEKWDLFERAVGYHAGDPTGNP